MWREVLKDLGGWFLMSVIAGGIVLLAAMATAEAATAFLIKQQDKGYGRVTCIYRGQDGYRHTVLLEQGPCPQTIEVD
mgnify:CR=1 FL=1